MAVFVCDKCKTIENTALGWYWSRNKNQRMLGNDYPNGEAYCRCCTPLTFVDGIRINKDAATQIDKDGVERYCWHNRFAQETATIEYCLKSLENEYMEPTGAMIDVLGGPEQAAGHMQDINNRILAVRKAKQNIADRQARHLSQRNIGRPNRRPGKKGKP